ncbi:MAG: 4Fe-4S dicluster domain-containing protein [Myxococcota bacterium]
MSSLPIVNSFPSLEPDTELGAPPRRPGTRPSAVAVASAVALAAGFLGLIASFFGAPMRESWVAIVGTYGLIIGGAVGGILARYVGTTPGIEHDNIFFSGATHRGLAGWGLGFLLTGFYVLLYWFPDYLEGGVRMLDPLARLLSGGPASRWFMYGFFYTLAVALMGVRMVMKYRHNRYQIIRTASVVFFQLGFAFLVPQFLKALDQPEFYFSYFWPLKYDYLLPSSFSYLTQHPGGWGTFMLGWGAIATFVATPVLTYFFGKRWYCSWVCGCGGLAETLGDPFRQLSDKSTRAWKIERWMIHSVLIAVAVVTGLLWINHASEGAVFGPASQAAKKWYGFAIGSLFSGVIGVGFYPILGSRIWCRFGCPLAAILGIIQRFFSRFRITTNGGQCISCGNCSTYCEMGIDVRAYAKRGANIVRASCVGCGVCAAVCPRGVLKLENGATHADRFDGADRPWRDLLRSLGIAERHI